MFKLNFFFHSKKLDFSDDEDQSNEKSNKQSLNGDIRNKPDHVKGYYSNKIPNCDSNVVQHSKVLYFCLKICLKIKCL